MNLEEFKEKIRDMKFQGAVSVAEHAAEFLVDWSKKKEFNSKEEVLKEINRLKKELTDVRPTEPAMRDTFRYVSHHIKNSDSEDYSELRKVIKRSSKQIEQKMKGAMGRVAVYGSHMINNGDTILTHCHSHTVELMFKRALKDDKDFKVINTETRPLYQGRKTSKRLLDKGIDTTMIVDSAVGSYIDQVDFVVVGADAVTSSGYVINKIGTSQIAMMASEHNIPFYVATETYKFDPATLEGKEEEIEYRKAQEVWKDAPESLKIENPAFDVTPRKYIKSLITEKGIYPPEEIAEIFDLE